MPEPDGSAPDPRTSPPPGAYTARPSAKASGAPGLAHTPRPVVVAAVLLGLGALDGPALTPKRAGVTALVLPSGESRLTRDFDGRGDDVGRRAGAVFERPDGSRGEYADVWFRTQTGAGPIPDQAAKD